MSQQTQQKRITKPVRVHEEWHFTLKVEAAQKGLSISKFLEKILTAHFLPSVNK